MQLKTFRHLWGITDPFQQVFQLIKNAGYSGVEFAAIRIADKNSFKKLLNDFDFEFITQVHTYGETVDDHLASFKALIQQSLPFNPVMINSHSGKDSWGQDEKNEFFASALDYEKEIGISIAHEIHRGRITYNPWDTRDFLLNFADLKICCDFSHWVCVCERLLYSETAIIQLCAESCIHLHSRVGYEHGPQVPDPRAAEYAKHLKAHENWWDIIWRTQQRNQVKTTTMTPEFGPPANSHRKSYTHIPASDVWTISNWMNDRQKQRFNQLFL
ncbi:MAG: sugar phosphate isomerase/epimerase [Ferruginibacter sp.]|nr:sugar phosphate isomerase/epimerase [Ferruginibacter sp.]